MAYPNASPAPPSRSAPRCCITLNAPPHRWTFSFAPNDADQMLARLDELARDPAAPLDAAAATVLREEFRHVRSRMDSPQAGSENADRST